VFARLGRTVAGHPVIVLLIWLVTVGGIISTGNAVLGKEGVDGVTDTTSTGFLPEDYESVRAAEVSREAFGQSAQSTAIIVVRKQDGSRLTERDSAAVLGIAEQLRKEKIPTLESVSAVPAQMSPDGTTRLVSLGFSRSSQDTKTMDAVDKARKTIEQASKDTELTAGLTGEAAFAYDDKDTNALVQTGMIIVILTLLLLIFRAPLLALLTLLMVGAVSTTVQYTLGIAAKQFDFELDPSTISLLPIVLFGLGTDYVVFLLYRYREGLRAGADRRQSMEQAVAKVGAAITSSGLVVIASLSAMLLSLFGSFRMIGISIAIAVLGMLITGLTAVPAVFRLIGPVVFWPSRSHRREPRQRIAGAVGKLVETRPAAVTAVVLVALVGLAGCVLGLRTNYEQANAPRGSESEKAYNQLTEGFPAGILNPTEVFLTGSSVNRSTAESFAQQLSTSPVVGALGGVQVQGDVARIVLQLRYDPYSTKAIDGLDKQLKPLAAKVAPAGSQAWVGGNTSAYSDIRRAVNRDMKVIFPVAAVLIGVILLLALPGLIAPGYLLGAVGLGFLGTLGAGVVMFQTIRGEAGVGFNVPLIVYLFVSSLGADYTILMISRIREERQAGHGPRRAAALALRHAGPAVASAGTILAGSFACLMLSAQTMQIGFVVATGVMISAFVLAWLLVPALTALLGHKAFWPSRKHRAAVGAAGLPEDGIERAPRRLGARATSPTAR
jgi:putative drug exporter of the RND superfamily